MTVSQWLVDAMIRLKEAGVPNGRTDALIILADLFETDKSWVHSHPEHEIDDLQLRELEYKLGQRLKHIPLAYIRGFKEFYGRNFTVNSQVLIPRPESESFIEILKELALEAPRIADIGTGSGCLGITAALEIPDAQVDVYDIDMEALVIAKLNATQLEVEVGCYESNLLGSLRGEYDVILANLPYVPDGMITSPEITKEPELALFSGNDGLDHYRIFWDQMSTIKSQYVLTEELESQHDVVAVLADKAGYSRVQTDMLVSLFKRR